MTLLANFLVPTQFTPMANNRSATFAGVVFVTRTAADFPSSVPPILQPLAGQPVLVHTLETARKATRKSPTLLLEQGSGSLPEEQIPEGDWHLAPGGSNLVSAVESHLLRGVEHLLLVPANLPLLGLRTLERLMAAHLENRAKPVITAAVSRLPAAQFINHTISEQDFESTSPLVETNNLVQPAENSMVVCCISAGWLRELQTEFLDSLTSDNLAASLVQAASTAGLSVQSFEFVDPTEALVVETLVDLSTAETIMRQRTNEDLMRSGVTIIDPKSTYIDPQVEVGRDTVIHPNTYLRGKSRIGKACLIGPNSMIVDTTIGDRCEVTFSVTESAILEDDVDIGPFAHLRKGAHLAQGVHMGNYGEVKNSYLGPGTKMGHFSYIGDADIVRRDTQHTERRRFRNRPAYRPAPGDRYE